MIHADISRRHALATAAGVTAAGLGTAGLTATPATAAAHPFKNEELEKALRRLEARNRRILTGRPSANQWDMQKAVDAGGDIVTQAVPGTGLEVEVRAGDVGTLLIHTIRRFHYEIDALGLHGEPTPLKGWTAPSTVRNSGLPQSNQASGTAVVIRPNSYPPGVRGGFTKSEQLVIRDIIADTEGLIRWAGDDRPAYEGLFYLTAHPDDARLTRVAAKIRTWNETPGVGAGVAADMTQPSRQRRAARYQ
ncbi:hypothetical protein [Streptomyces coelicoflavus]|uniref:hypothetical protein n=1 Tax=Streptomyces coelicoflavus TaxID=285562 RepID=UPI0036AB2848